MTTVISIILLILILGVIILVHELGHFLWAKKFKVHIYEFSIGMGPILFTKKGKDGIDYNVRAVPIGGFVSMAGEVYEDDSENKIAKEDFMCNKKWYQRVIILVAGVVNNFIMAILVLFFVGLIWGGATVTTTIDTVAEDSRAAEAGLEDGDKITVINGYDINNWDVATIVMFAIEDEDGKYDFVVERDGKEEKITVEPEVVKNEDDTESLVFGVNMTVKETDGFLDSITYAFEKFASVVDTMLMTLGGLFTGKISLNALAGPIGMYEVVEQSTSIGLSAILYLVAFLSINVGFLNILPFPAFDGGRLLFLIIEKIKGSPVNSKVENIFHLVGFVLLILLSIYIAIQDVIRLF